MPTTVKAKNILIIEDEVNLCHLMQRLLQRRGYTIFAALTGQEGLSHFEKQKDSLDLVILDMHLPDFSCRQIVEKILQSNNQMKILLTTGIIEAADLSSYPNTENIMVLMKPYDNKTLLEKIDNFF